MSTELVKANASKEIQAMIDTVSISTPKLKNKISVAAVCSYLQMPDESFGWTAKGAMPNNVKLAAVAAHLEAGASPGYGQIYYLGNKLYRSAAFVQSKANGDPDWNIVGEAKYRPHSKDEKDMFGLNQGDMSCRVTMQVVCKGNEMIVEGDGIIGKDELNKKSANGYSKPGLDTTKNKAMTLKTRAVRDLLNRFYPSNGLPIAPDSNSDEMKEVHYAEQIKLSESRTEEERIEVVEAVAVESEVDLKEHLEKKAKEFFDKMAIAAKEKKLTLKEILEVSGFKTKKALIASDKALETIDSLCSYIESYVKPEKVEVQPEKVEEKVDSKIHVEAASKRLLYQVDRVTKEGGQPMTILKDNPHNIIETGDLEKINAAYKLLLNHVVIPPKNPDPLAGVWSDDDFEIPKEEEGKKAYEMIEKLLANNNIKDTVKASLKTLKTKKLKLSDDIYIVKAARIAQTTGDFAELNDIIKDRELA